MVLSEDQIHRFHDQGYLTVEDLLSSAQVEALDAETRDYHARLRAHVPSGVDVSWEPKTQAGGAPKIQQVLHAERVSALVDELLRSAPVLDCVGSLLGPDIALFESKLLMKSARVGEPIPWHQDFAYWREYTAAPVQVSCLVCIDPADGSNGCLEVVPGSHASGLYAHAEGPKASAFVRGLGDRFDRRDAVRVPGRPGSAILLHPLLLHGSGANRSERERRSLTLVYTIPGVHDHHREVLRTRAVPADLDRFFPVTELKCFTGPGPHGGQCAANYRRRELWKLAAYRVEKLEEAWVEVASADPEGDAFVWLAARKPVAAPLVRFDQCPSLASNREDARIVGGSFQRTIPRASAEGLLGDRVGLLLVDSPHYSTVKRVLVSFARHLQPGTILVFDAFYGSRNPGQRMVPALREFLEERGLRAEYLGRADSAVALRLTGAGGRIRCAAIEWTPTVEDLAFEHALENADPTESVPWERRRGKRRRVRRLLRGAGRWVRRARERLRGPSPLETFFPLQRIPRFVGEGPVNALGPTHSRRRQLWEYTISLIEDPSLCWCEFGVGEGESIDWFALRKPRSNVLYGFDSFEGISEPWGPHPVGQWRSDVYRPNRPDVVIVEGLFDASLSRAGVLASLGDQIGLLHVDCDLFSATRTVLEGIDRLIQPGTLVLFDELYGYPGWEACEVRAFHEYVLAKGVSLEWIARSDFQASARILSRGGEPNVSVRMPAWKSTAPGIRLATG